MARIQCGSQNKYGERYPASRHPGSLAGAPNSVRERKNRGGTSSQAQSAVGLGVPKPFWLCPQTDHREKNASLGTGRSTLQRLDAFLVKMFPLPETRRGSRESAQTFAETVRLRGNCHALTARARRGGGHKAACRMCSRSLAAEVSIRDPNKLQR